MKLALLTAVFIMLMPAFVYGADSYLCTPYLSTGFSYDEKSSNWDITNFKIEEKQNYPEEPESLDNCFACQHE